MMFKTFAVALRTAVLLFVPNLVSAQKVKAAAVPAAVKAAFSTQFPQAQRVKWEMEKPQVYEAGFRVGKDKMSACFNALGTWIETETEIKVSDLPVAVSRALQAKYVGYEIEEAEKLQFPNGTTVFEMEIEKGKDSLEVQFDAAGKFLKQDVEKE